MNKNLISFLTLTQREINRFMRIWKQTLLPSLITTILFLTIFGLSIGSEIKQIRGYSYIEFILPGLIMMSVIRSSYVNSSFSFYVSKFRGNLQEVLTSMISPFSIVSAYLVSSVLRGLIVGSLIYLVSLFFVNVPGVNLIYAFLMLILISSIFSLLGIITGVWAEGFDKVNVFNIFLLTPMTWLSGVFYSVSMLPPFWAKLSLFNPVYYMVEVFRYIFIGESLVNVSLSLVYLMVLFLILYTFTIHLIKVGYKIRS